MFYFLLLVYIGLLIAFRKHKLVLMLLLMQAFSVVSAIIINLEDYSDEPVSYFNMLFILLCTVTITLPWKSVDNIEEIVIVNPRRVKKLTDILIVINALIFIVLLIVVVIVNKYVTDINQFKYTEGEAMEFYYRMLPFNVRFFILAMYLYFLAYFMLPLHFYHLYNGDKKRALWCGLLSINTVLYGLTYFSRWVLLDYILYFMALWLICSRLIPAKIKKKEMKVMTVLFIAGVVAFLAISLSRFSENKDYENRIPSKSRIQNTTLYSLLEYAGQSNQHGIYFLNRYDGRTFNGGNSFDQTRSFFQAIGLVGPSQTKDLKDKLWDGFTGFPGWTVYIVYDFGYIGALIVCFIYFRMAGRSYRKIKLTRLFLISLLLHIPLSSIFYSVLDRTLFCLIILFFIKMYLNIPYNVHMRHNKAIKTS